MATQVTATVVDGMLKLDQKLPLADETRVHLTVEPIVEKSDAITAWESLKLMLDQRPLRGVGPRFTRDELHERR
jgi:hypothetical protein